MGDLQQSLQVQRALRLAQPKILDKVLVNFWYVFEDDELTFCTFALRIVVDL